LVSCTKKNLATLVEKTMIFCSVSSLTNYCWAKIPPQDLKYTYKHEYICTYTQAQHNIKSLYLYNGDFSFPVKENIVKLITYWQTDNILANW
jgi:hypothetical protein